MHITPFDSSSGSGQISHLISSKIWFQMDFRELNLVQIPTVEQMLLLCFIVWFKFSLDCCLTILACDLLGVGNCIVGDMYCSVKM